MTCPLKKFVKTEEGVVGKIIKFHKDVDYVDLLLSNGEEISSSLKFCSKPTIIEIDNWRSEFFLDKLDK